MTACPQPADAAGAKEPASPFISIEDVSYRYPGATRPALQEITLHIARGQYVVLLGHNGSGKSTLARLLNGLLLPERGRIRVAGFDTRDLANQRVIRERVGMIFSNPDNQIVATLVEDDVAWGLAARGLPADAIAAHVSEALAAVGLEALRARPPESLSGGQRQRLAIAGVLALEPACIVADEPTAMLDPLARREVTALLRRLHRERGLTVVHVTHLLEEAALANIVVVLEEGAIALRGTPAEVFGDLDRLRALRLVVPESARLAERLRALGVAVPAEAITPEAIAGALIQRQGAQV